ncbi:MAG TPA: hypothetical protein VKG23_00945, partial [Thermoanaerobaculia bacterium]|nr:hypothetical protein [Thermoanaerobaculia bacterium]
RSIRDHLSETSASVESGAAVAEPVRRTRLSRWLPLAAAAVFAALGLGYVLGTRRHAPVPTFEQLTFRRGTVLKARFAPDGQTVVYSAAWEGKPVEVFSSRLGSPESRPLGVAGASLFAVSSTGELALALGWHYVGNWESRSTLARVPISGGAPKEVLEEVEDADWSPDGKELAVVRQVGDARVLEYPIGRRIYETVAWLSRPRISPDGKTIALIEHPARGDNMGRILLVPVSGKSRAISPVGPVGPVAWSADGTYLWTTLNTTLLRVSTDGHQEIVTRIPEYGSIEDVSREGKLLLSVVPIRREIVGLAPGETRERNLSWLDWSYPTGLSKDARELLFEEQNRGPDYALYIRKTDGSDAVRLGTGRAFALSPDGHWALGAATSNPEHQLLLIPTGPGEIRKLVNTNLTYYSSANFFPDGRRLLVQASEPGHGNRMYIQDLDGPPRPIAPEGLGFGRWNAISPDGKHIAVLTAERRIALFVIESRQTVPIRGTEPDESPIGWTADGRSLYVGPTSGVPAQIHLVNLETGQRTLWKTLDAPDPAGILRMSPYFIAEDGQSYVYSYRREVGDLFLVEGLK